VNIGKDFVFSSHSIFGEMHNLNEVSGGPFSQENILEKYVSWVFISILGIQHTWDVIHV